MLCSNCSKENISNSKFCSACGYQIGISKEFDITKPIWKITSFFLVLLIYVGIINVLEFEINYKKKLLIDGLFSAMIVVATIIEHKNILPLFRLKKIKLPLFFIITFVAPAIAYGISHLAEYLNQLLFNEVGVKYYYDFIFSDFPLLLTIISIGIIPGIFEELAFRGVVFNQLNLVFNLKISILISSILFTILHISIISFIWIFPIGILLGYLKAKYRTLWYSMYAHFLYNSSIVLIEYFNL